MAGGRSAAEFERFLAGRAGHLLAAAVLPAGGRDAGEDLLQAVAGPAKVAKWPVPERPIPPADEQRAGQRQARGEPRVRVSPGWTPGAGTHQAAARRASAGRALTAASDLIPPQLVASPRLG